MRTIQLTTNHSLVIALCLTAFIGQVSGEEALPLPKAPPPEAAANPSAEGVPFVQELPDVPAEDTFVPSDTFGIPLSFTLRGGVSLGSFEAGYIYYITEAVKQNPGLFDPRLVTGASAGSINALLLLMALGEEAAATPQESILYRTWTDLTQKTLLDTDNPDTPVGAFSSGAALLEAANKIEAEWNKGLRDSFEMIVGMSTTRLDPFEVEIAEGFKLQKQSEKFVFLIRGQGPGRAPQITNYIHAKKGLVQAMLPFEQVAPGDSADVAKEKDKRNFAMIRDVLLASSAFPVGFPPRRLNYCLVPVDENTTGNECTKATESDLFIDGGVFDNNPLRIAHRIASAGLTRDSEGRLIRKAAETTPYLYTYLDPDHTSYPAPLQKVEEEAKPFAKEGRSDDRDVDVLKMIPGFLGSFVNSARAAELYALVEEYPEVRKTMKLTNTDYPLVSNELGAFFGFFDREFLKYDFYLGMYSAHNYVKQTVERYINAHKDPKTIEGFKNAKLPEQGKFASSGWSPYFCMRSWFDGEEEFRDACKDLPNAETARQKGAPDMASFRILTQVSLDRLYDQCANLSNVKTEHRHCRIAMADRGSPPRLVIPKEPQQDGYWKRCRVCKKDKGRCTRKSAEIKGCVCACDDKKADEESFLYTMRLLTTYGFYFRDLGVAPDRTSDGMYAIRARFLDLLTAFSEKHSDNRRRIYSLLGKSAVNFFQYDPPDQIVHLAVWSSLELGWSRAFRHLRWLRLTVTPLQLRGGLDIFTTKTVAFAPTVGFEGELLPLSSALLQLRIGVRLGYQLSTRGGFTDDTCAEDDASSSTIYCSYPLAQFLASVSLYERVRVQIGVEWSPPWFEGVAPQDNHWVTLIAGIGWQWLSPF